MIQLAAMFSISHAAIALAADADDRASQTQHERIRTLVGMLASKNEDPKNREGGTRPFPPPGYDLQAQALVYLAIQQLLSEGSAAFNVLIENFDNERYSYSYSSPMGTFDRTVGDVCREIMQRMIICYDHEIELITRDQDSIYSTKDLKQWWKKNSKRPLWKIQVEAIDKAVKFFETVEWETASTIHPYAKKMPEEEFEEGRKANLRILGEIRAVILEREEAYTPKSLDQYYGNMIGLPWPVQRFSK